MEHPITWTFVWQGAMSDDEAEAFADAQPQRLALFDHGGLWLESMGCQEGQHIPRIHPDESFRSYCVLCGQYPVQNPELLAALEKAQAG
jgi:hypothetical protein